MKYQRIIVKIGTNLITKDDFSLNEAFLKDITDQVAALEKNGYRLIIVTSGAVACGRSRVKLKKETRNIPVKQMMAAVGQSILMHHYVSLFEKHGLRVAQVLLTEDDFRHRKNFLNTRNIMNRLLHEEIIPIVNENDVTAYEEIQFGDNDMLSGKLASMVEADLLVLLTDVDGLYTSDPQRDANAKRIPVVSRITEEIKKMATDPVSRKSLGGMKTKLRSAEYATQAGIDTMIAPGKTKDVLLNIVKKGKSLGTLFAACLPVGKADRKEGKKRWMQAQIVKKAFIEIDQGACRALQERGSSLLPAGITRVEGAFQRGDVVQVRDQQGKAVAFGLVNYEAKDLRKIQGKKTHEISEILESCFEPEAIHRDNLRVA